MMSSPLCLAILAFSFLSPACASPDATLLTCPANNGQQYTATDGAVYQIECYTDRPFGDLPGAPVGATSLQNCIALCELNNGCIDVAFYPPADGQQNGTCWEKSQANSGVTNNNVWGARQISPSTVLTCPKSNGVSYTAKDGNKYTIECYIDRPGNDLSTTQATTLENCVETCETTNGCIDAAFAPPATGSLYGTCWAKSFAGQTYNNNNRLGARKQSVLSCPGSNGQTYRVADGATYAIECSLDRPGNDVSNNPATQPSLEACIASCEKTTGCVDVAWYSTTHVCWLKRAAGGTATNNAVWNARQLTKASSTATTTSTCTPTPTASTGKRGLGYNNATFTQPFSLNCQNSRVNWAYNWGSSPYYPYSQATTGTFNPVLHYVPMLWSNASVLTSIFADNVNAAISNNMADAVLGFNEPDACADGSSCMTVPSAVTAWKSYIQPFRNRVTLVSPAVTNSLAAGQGLNWLSSFISQCTSCQIDAIALHWYGDPNSPSSFQNYIAGAYTQFNKPIYITEFGTNGGSVAQVTSFLQTVLPWIDQQAYITRAAYLMDAPNPSGTWLIDSNGTVNSVGKLYNTV